MIRLKEQLKELISIGEAEWESFAEQLVKENLKAKTELLRAGQIARKIYFIEEGLMRCYHLKDGKEVSTYFACDQQFISAYASFITQEYSFEYLETLEDSIVYSLSNYKFNRLLELSPKFEKLARILAERNYLCVLNRIFSMQTKSAKEHYLEFIEQNELKVLQRVPQYMIASFLGIAPESLSRIRKQISSS